MARLVQLLQEPQPTFIGSGESIPFIFACMKLIKFISAKIKPKPINAPGASIITAKGLNHSPKIGTPNTVPAPKPSLIAPSIVKEIAKPAPIPSPSAIDGNTGFL